MPKRPPELRALPNKVVFTGLMAGAAAFYGGWEWALLSVLVLIAVWRADLPLVAMLATMGVSYFWLGAFHWTGDRRLFFPYAMQFAVQMPELMRGRVRHPIVVGGGGTIAVFLLIRVIQSASASVLVVELVIAASILALAAMVRTRVLAGVIASTLAFAALAI